MFSFQIEIISPSLLLVLTSCLRDLVVKYYSVIIDLVSF